MRPGLLSSDPWRGVRAEELAGADGSPPSDLSCGNGWAGL
jgi:hypothetical protein